MRHDIDIEPRLSSWLEGQARDAPDELLPRVMREVASMSQESTTFRTGLLSSAMVGWLTAGIVLAAIAVSVGGFMASLRGVPAGEQGAPSPVATPSWTAETIGERDPVGDAGNAPDIVAVGIRRVSDDLLTLEIELAEPMALGADLMVLLETDGVGPYTAAPRSPVLLKGPEECSAWFMEEIVSVGRSGSVQSHAGTWLPSAVLSRTSVTLDIPLQELGVTDKLAFQLLTHGTDSAMDWFPGETDGCYPMIWESSPSQSER